MANTEKRMNDKLRSIMGSLQKTFGSESIRLLDGESNTALDAIKDEFDLGFGLRHQALHSRTTSSAAFAHSLAIHG